MTIKNVEFRQHIGGGWYVSVSSWILCRLSEIFLSTRYKGDKTNKVWSSTQPTWVVEVCRDNQVC